MAYARHRYPRFTSSSVRKPSATTVDASQLMREQFGIRAVFTTRTPTLAENQKIIRQTSVEIEVFGS